jgi:hypothetical protein
MPGIAILRDDYSSKGPSEANDSRYGGMKPITREILYDNPEKERMLESPDRRLVANMAPVNNVMNIWVGSLDNQSQRKSITNDTSRRIHTYGWMRDSRTLTFTPKIFVCGVDVCGPSNLTSHLLRIPPY